MLRTLTRTTILAMSILLLTACLAVGDLATAPVATPLPLGSFPTPEPHTVPLIPHTVTGITDCLICHSPAGTQSIPANHAQYTNDRCLGCHRPSVEVTPTVTLTPQPMPHAMTGRQECYFCHAPRRLEMPRDHDTLALETCTECHTPPDVTPTVQSP